MLDTNILITGGSGLLGSELKKHFPNAKTPTQEELDITNLEAIREYLSRNKIDMIIHCAALMPPSKSDTNPDDSITTNIIGTSFLTVESIKNDIRLVYVSTDYVFSGNKGNYGEEDELMPVNKYAWSKLGGECAVRMYDKGLVIHTSFGPNVFPYDKAFINQWTSKETVKVFAKKLAKAANSDITGVLNIGGKRKTVYEYAMETTPNKELIKAKIEEMLPKYILPKDTSLDTTKYKNLFEKDI